MAGRTKFVVIVVAIQVLFILIFAIFVDYGEELDATSSRNFFVDVRKRKENNLHEVYSMFQDTNAIVFVGVGFLYTFLKKYSYSGIGMTMLLAALSIQFCFLTDHWWSSVNGKVQIDIKSILQAEFGAVSAIIAMGAVFGKMSPLQMIFFALFEVFVYNSNEHFCWTVLQICDVGASVSLHMFAGIFGCAAAFATDRKRCVQDNPNEATSYESDIFCMLGTVVIWCFWPSFNASLAKDDLQYRTVMNTFLALLSGTAMAFAMSALVHKVGKFTMSHIQNATLAGAVAIGATSALMIHPFGAVLIGSVGASLSVFGFKFFSPFLAKHKVHDPCGINSLHGIPGFFGGLTGVIAALFANEKNYGHGLYQVYPAMAPFYNSSALLEIQRNSPDIVAGVGRTAVVQAGFQLLYVAEVMLVAAVAGLITGFCLSFDIFDPIEEKQMFLDEVFWEIPGGKENAEYQESNNKLHQESSMDTKI